MAEVTPRDVHQDQYLTNISISYRNPIYIADEIFPIVPVRKQSDLIPAYDQSHWFRNLAALRAPGTESRRAGFSVSNSTYYCNCYSFGFEIPDELRDNADAPYDMDRDGTEFVTDKLQMAREINLSTIFMTTGVWGSDAVGGTDFTLWSDYGASTPLLDFTTYMDTIDGRIAREPNLAVFGKQTWNQLRWHPDLIDTIKYTQRGQMTTDLLATLLGVDRVLIGRAIYTTSQEGTAEASVTYQRVWGKHALLLYTPPRASLMTPASGYCFTWQRVPNSIQYVERLRNAERRVDILDGLSYWDQRLTAARAGLFLSGAVA